MKRILGILVMLFLLYSYAGAVGMDVNEKKPIVYDIYSKNVVFDDNSSLGIDKCIYKFDIPRLNNYVPKKKYKRFIKALNKVNNNVLIKISDISSSLHKFSLHREFR